MFVSYVKNYDKEKKRVEFLLVNFDYYDGNEYLAELFNEKYGFCICDKFDGIWFKIIHIGLEDCLYEMIWNEEIGNSIYCINQSEKANDLLEERLRNVINTINERIQL